MLTRNLALVPVRPNALVAAGVTGVVRLEIVASDAEPADIDEGAFTLDGDRIDDLLDPR